MTIKKTFKIAAVAIVAAIAFVNAGMEQDKKVDDATAKTWVCNYKETGANKTIKFRVTDNRLFINGEERSSLRQDKHSVIITGGFHTYGQSEDNAEPYYSGVAANWQFSADENKEPHNINKYTTNVSCKMIENDEGSN